jgi:oligoendopeptidase F
MTEESAHWDLRDLFGEATAAQLDSTIDHLEQAVVRLESFRPQLAPEISDGTFVQALDTYEALTSLQRRLGGYSFLRFAEDTQDQDALNLQNRVDALLANVETRTVFFDLWFKALPEESAARLIAASGDRRYYLESCRRLKPFTLTEPEERIITLKDVNGVEALVTLYDMITSAFTFTLEVEGERKTLTEAEIAALVRHPSAEVRAAAYHELYRVYTEHRAVLAQIYNHRVRDWHAEMVELRHFAEPISARNIMNDIPDPVVQTLLAVCRNNVHVFQRYFRIKARWLHQDKLHRYDLYAPFAPSEQHYTVAQALDMVLDSFRSFSPLMEEQARQVLNQNHLDALPRQNKRGGAFCYSVLPELTPWVLANFAGRGRGVATLAHELGHAIHALMAAGHSVLTYDASAPLSETASIFGEMLLSERLLAGEAVAEAQRSGASEGSAATRRELLAAMLDDAFATVQRQAYFTLFECDAHRLVAEGKSVEDLAEHYRSNLAEQFGDAVEVSDEFQWEWLLVPHIYTMPFYTYAYCFGQLLVMALFQRYRLEGESFKPKYLKILSYGGSAPPATILAEAGIDIASAAFWQGGYDLIASWIDQLEATERG